MAFFCPKNWVHLTQRQTPAAVLHPEVYAGNGKKPPITRKNVVPKPIYLVGRPPILLNCVGRLHDLLKASAHAVLDTQSFPPENTSGTMVADAKGNDQTN